MDGWMDGLLFTNLVCFIFLRQIDAPTTKPWLLFDSSKVAGKCKSFSIWPPFTYFTFFRKLLEVPQVMAKSLIKSSSRHWEASTRGWHRVLKFDVIILQTFPFEPLNLIMWYAQLLQERGQNFKSLALMNIEIWSFTRSHTNLCYLVSVPNFRNKH